MTSVERVLSKFILNYGEIENQSKHINDGTLQTSEIGLTSFEVFKNSQNSWESNQEVPRNWQKHISKRTHDKFLLLWNHSESDSRQTLTNILAEYFTTSVCYESHGV